MEVRGWPVDGAAAAALRLYVERAAQGVAGPLNAFRLDFTGADLSGLTLNDANFAEGTLDGVALYKCVLNRVDFTSAKISRCRFDDAEMMGADLMLADGRQAPT